MRFFPAALKQRAVHRNARRGGFRTDPTGPRREKSQRGGSRSGRTRSATVAPPSYRTPQRSAYRSAGGYIPGSDPSITVAPTAF
jgi:hypothetical protein